VGGVVPDTAVDDVIIASGHMVVILPYSYVALANSHMVTVENGASLLVVGGIEVLDQAILQVNGEFEVLSGAWASVYYDGYFDVNSGALVTIDGSIDFYYSAFLSIYGDLTVESNGDVFAIYGGEININGGTVSVHGYLGVDQSGYMSISGGTFIVESDGQAFLGGNVLCDSAYLDVYGEMTVSSYGYVEAVYSSEVACESSGLLTVNGSLLVADDGSCRVWGPVTLSRSAAFDAWYYGYLEINAGGVVDDYGYLYIHYDAMLYVGGEMRVYKDIYISGEMYGGGRILMLRREGQIKDESGSSLFMLDQAYGHGQFAIA